MEYSTNEEFEKVKQFVKENEKVKNFWFDKEHCVEFVRIGKELAKTKSLPKVAYCFMCLNRVEEMIKAINRVKNYVDKIVAVDGGSVDNTIEFLQNIEKCDIVRRKWDDKFNVQRNQYLNRVLKCYPDYWILVSDTDEWYCKELMENLKYILLAIEEIGCNRVGFMSWFKMVETEDSPKNFEKPPAFKTKEQGGIERTFYKKLCFKAQEGMEYVKSPHEGLLGNWKIANLANLDWYFEHVKTRKSEVERGARNYFIAGPSMKKDDRWLEFRKMTSQYGWELWSDMYSAMISHKVMPKDVLEWIWSRKDWDVDGPPSSEQREYWLLYYDFLHPDLKEKHEKEFGNGIPKKS